MFNETTSDKAIINEYILEFFENDWNHNKKKSILDFFKSSNEEKSPHNIMNYLEKNIPTHKVLKIDDYDDLTYTLLSGFTIVIIDGCDFVLSIETKRALDSGIKETSIETVIKGPRDAFTENFETNIGLIRKRTKSNELWLQELVIGARSNTRIAIMFINDIADKKLVDSVIKKIDGINIDSIQGSNYVIDLITENHTVFPNYISTERPDRVTQYLLEGRVAIVVENTPFTIIVPGLFVDFLHSPEDNYMPTINASFTRIVRWLGLLITLLVPAIYVAIITYNHEAIPGPLLLNLAEQREIVPLPAIIEALAMITTFEILKEADIRLPRNIGSALSIVGALVLGDAAIQAGLVSPFMVIVIAISAISSLLVYSLDFVNGIRLWRIIFLLFASTLGLIGILIAGMFFLINLSNIKSFGIPYVAPLSPFFKDELGGAFIINQRRKFQKRSVFTASKNLKRYGGKIK